MNEQTGSQLLQTVIEGHKNQWFVLFQFCNQLASCYLLAATMLCLEHELWLRQTVLPKLANWQLDSVYTSFLSVVFCHRLGFY